MDFYTAFTKIIAGLPGTDELEITGGGNVVLTYHPASGHRETYELRDDLVHYSESENPATFSEFLELWEV